MRIAQKPQLDESFNSGFEAGSSGLPSSANPHITGVMWHQWQKGWNASKINGEESDPMAKKKSGAEQLKEAGHDVTDPAVQVADDRLSQLLKQLDDNGVQLVEEEWRNFSDAEKTVASDWLNHRRSGLDRPVPQFLMRFATDQLKAQVDSYQQKQSEHRKIMARCTFGKPSAILPTGDEGDDKIKMSLVIPDDDLNRPSIPEDLFVWRRVRVAFSLRALDKWTGVMPGMDDGLPEIIECETEVKGYTRGKKSYKISFPVSCDLIDDNTAVRTYAGHQGSVRFELIGNLDEPATVAPVQEKEKREPVADGQKSMAFEAGEIPFNQRVKDDRFVSADEYWVPTTGKMSSAIIYIGVKGGRYFGSRSCVFVDKEGQEQEEDWMQPLASGSSYSSLNAAICAEIGTLIDYSLANKASDGFISDLRAEYKRLDEGGIPNAVDSDDEDGDD